MRRPALVAGVTTVALLVVASPSLRTHWSGIDASVLPTSQSARVVSDKLASDFPAAELNTITIAATAPASGTAQLDAYAHRLVSVPGVVSARAPEYLGRGVWQLTLGASGDPISSAAQRTVDQVRATPAPVPVAVGGQAADFHDQQAAIVSSAPLALAVLVVLTLVDPVADDRLGRAPVQGAGDERADRRRRDRAARVHLPGWSPHRLTRLYQPGRDRADRLPRPRRARVRALDRLRRAPADPDQGGPRRGLSDREAIAVGLEHTGRLVTAAAILLAVAIGAFATSKVVFLKEVGVGAAAAVLIDAFVVRALLVPSLMALLGWRNWWSPGPLRRLHDRLGIDETAPGRKDAIRPVASPANGGG